MLRSLLLQIVVTTAALFLQTTDLHAQPAQNEYLVDGLNLSDNYSAGPLQFDGQVKDLSPEMKICERSFIFPGIAGGLNYTDAMGQPGTLNTWRAPGIVAEIRIGTKNGAFLAFHDPFSDSFLKVSEIDLKHILSNGALRVYGLYLDFRSSGASLPYAPQAFFLEGVPLGLGLHPIDPGRTVIYATLEEHELDSLDLFLGGISISQTESKLKVSIGSESEPTLPLSVMLFLLGIEDFEMPPVNEVTIGLLLGQKADYNGNGAVDAADYTVWRDNLGITEGATVFKGDGDSDGDVDNNDYQIWRGGFGGSVAAGEEYDCSGWESIVAPALIVPHNGRVFLGETILDTGEVNPAKQQPTDVTDGDSLTEIAETTNNSKITKRKKRPKKKRKKIAP